MSHTVVDGNGVLKYVTSYADGASSSPLVMVHMGYSEYTLHQGLVYVHSDMHTISNHNTFVYLLKTPANRHVTLNGFSLSTSSSPVFVDIYEGSIVTANGTSEGLYNLNRTSTNATTSNLYISPTITDNGVRLLSAEVPGDKNIGGNSATIPSVILKPSENYTFHVSNESGASAEVSFTIIIEDMEL